ncbi:hypothetical protein ARC20_05310 [Stenotrophomonas panacihumi]|uniref:Transmembrane protein n=1 Tax=Stenotrophomonas panacihumi TaxID=676599 RepID=A0A0R0AME5_9GAMM|nr:hypothetical protein [Stenotrophomonas panacihumi]KRG46416.1 hypothetical protein ARC20_05310 [Stenotrophomonas panacihumi]PTN55121.1 hypothetical protein C9J98_07965 [Stenotrophomonas panacihumi]
MTRSTVRILLVMSLIWLVMVAGLAALFYPSVGGIAAIMEPNPFWSVSATGIPAAPFKVTLHRVPWLVINLGPLVALWGFAVFMTIATRPRTLPEA